MNGSTNDTDRAILAELRAIRGMLRLLHEDMIEERKSTLIGKDTRKRVYDACDGKTSVSAIAKALGISSPAVSQHIGPLTRAGLLALDDDGKFYDKTDW